MVEKEFWKRWIKANELERLEILRELPIFEGRDMVKAWITPTLLNSYFEDLVIYIQNNQRRIK